VLTIALVPKTDFSVLLNLLDSESANHDRTTSFGNRVDLVLRCQAASRGGFELTVAPRGTILLRGIDGGRAGATVAPQFNWGRNLAILNLTWTGAVGVSAANPRSDYLTSFDFYRTLDNRGTALFAGAQQEYTAGNNTIGTEQGLVIPFRNGQVEIETAQLQWNTSLEVQFQARVIVNWGKILGRRSKS